MSSVRKFFRNIIQRLFCVSPMAESTNPKRNRAERKKNKQKNDDDDDDNDVFIEQSKDEEKISETKDFIETMSSNPTRPTTTSSASATSSNVSTTKKPSTTNAPRKLSSGSEISELSDRLANTNVQTGPPSNIQPKPQLSKAERRAIQEAQRAAKGQKKTGGPATNESSQPASAPQKKTTTENVSTPITNISHRPQSDAGESAISGTSRSIRPPTLASVPPTTTTTMTNVTPTQSQQRRQQKKATEDRVGLFAHLPIYTRQLDRVQHASESKQVHPAIVKLGLQYASRQIVGSNLRCIAFLAALQKMLNDYTGPEGSTDSSILDIADLNLKLKTNINFITRCRPNAVTMGTAIRYLKTHIQRSLQNITIGNAKELLNEVIQNFVREKIVLSGVAIAETYAITKITDGDVILIFGYSSLIIRILETAIKRGIRFRVIIVDSRPQQHGLKSARRLLELNVKCTYVLINAVPFIISEVTKVLLGAHGLLGNGYVMSQVGTAQIALIAKTHNVPVLVCCETYKFCERVQTDSFVSNELGDPDDLIAGHPLLMGATTASGPSSTTTTTKTDSTPTSNIKLNVLNMTYDVTPPTFISAVITELGILPCTSVAVVIRMQNKQLDEICAHDQLNVPTAAASSSLNIVTSPSETLQ